MSLALTSLVLAVAPPALAQNGVTVDPDSPAAKEYALPIDAARRAASGGAAGETPSDGSAVAAPVAAFGAGVTKDAGGGKTKGRRSAPRRATASGAGADGGAPTTTTRERLPRELRAATATADDAALKWSVLGALAVLGVGGGLGFVLSRTRSRP